MSFTKHSRRAAALLLLSVGAPICASAECPYSLAGEWTINAADYVSLNPRPAEGDKSVYSGYIDENTNLVARVTTYCNANKEQIVRAELSNPGKAPYEILSGIVNSANPFEINFDVTKSGDPNSGPLRQWKKRN
jgi:hypothetical protein